MKNNKVSLFKAFKINSRGVGLFLKKYPQMIISRFFYTIWTSLSPYVGIYLTALIINELSTDRNIEQLKMLVILTLASAAFIAFVTALLNRWKNIQNSNLFHKVRGFYLEKVINMDYEICDDTKTSELLSTILQNQNGGGWGLYKVIGLSELVLSSVLKVLGGIVLTISLFTSKVPVYNNSYQFLNSPLIGIGVILLMIICVLLAPIFANKSESYFAKYSNLHNLGNRLFGFFGWLGYNSKVATDMRIYRQDKLCDKFNSDKTDVFGSSGFFAKMARGKMGILCIISSIFSTLLVGIIYLFVGIKAWSGAFGLGNVSQYIASITCVTSGLSTILRVIGVMINNTPFLELTYSFLDIPNKMYQGSLTIEKRADNDYDFEFKNVSFKYPGSEDFVLKNVNMKFKIGKKLAVVGKNGSGKTTFIKLLCRLYDPTEGEILLNGINIKKYDYQEYLSIFSVVFQDFNLLALTLGENVASSSNYDEDEVMSSLIKAGFNDNMKKMKNGLKTYISNEYDSSGISVSGGESQKIAIARTLYKNSHFIILDEPTAALDPIAEAEIYSKFNEIVEDKTAIYISHRLSSCKFCNEILVFDEGMIVQQGNHEDLVDDKNGKYFELWNAQAQYYNK